MTYADLVHHAATSYANASTEQLDAAVAWTPLWNARDVLAHLVANAERAVAGAEGPPEDDEAHALVLARREVPVSQLICELKDLAPRVVLPPFGPSQEWDIAVHLADVAEVWHTEPLPEVLWRRVLDQAVEFLAAIGREDPTVDLDNDYERFRSLFSRRERPGAFFG